MIKCPIIKNIDEEALLAPKFVAAKSSPEIFEVNKDRRNTSIIGYYQEIYRRGNLKQRFLFPILFGFTLIANIYLNYIFLQEVNFRYHLSDYLTTPITHMIIAASILLYSVITFALSRASGTYKALESNNKEKTTEIIIDDTLTPKQQRLKAWLISIMNVFQHIIAAALGFSIACTFAFSLIMQITPAYHINLLIGVPVGLFSGYIARNFNLNSLKSRSASYASKLIGEKKSVEKEKASLILSAFRFVSCALGIALNAFSMACWTYGGLYKASLATNLLTPHAAHLFCLPFMACFILVIAQTRGNTIRKAFYETKSFFTPFGLTENASKTEKNMRKGLCYFTAVELLFSTLSNFAMINFFLANTFLAAHAPLLLALSIVCAISYIPGHWGYTLKEKIYDNLMKPAKIVGQKINSTELEEVKHVKDDIAYIPNNRDLPDIQGRTTP